VIKVVLTGSECTGKTTLARALAEFYDAAVSREYSREFVETSGRSPRAEDVDEIARGQIELENEAVRRADDVVILDTDLLSTIVYSRHYYGDCPGWIDRTFSNRVGDIYLLAGVDVPWSEDGLHRDRGDFRSELQELFLNELRGRNLEYIELQGPHEARLRAARTAVDRLRRRVETTPTGELGIEAPG
jgi:NadR type nicotinamide-nucleotide adenylyltransferase